MAVCFTASQTVEIVVSDQPIPIQHYLRQPRRLVNALADPSRVEMLATDRFRMKMRSLRFLSLNIQPIVDLRIWSDDDGTTHVESTDSSIQGIDFLNERFALSLVGVLQPQQIATETHLTGRADLKVQVDLPPSLWFTPKSILETTGNGLLHSILLTIKQRLMHQLLLDYRRWAALQLQDGSSEEQTPFLSSQHSPG